MRLRRPWWLRPIDTARELVELRRIAAEYDRYQRTRFTLYVREWYDVGVRDSILYDFDLQSAALISRYGADMYTGAEVFAIASGNTQYRLILRSPL